MQNENYYGTSDLGLATALVCIGIPLASVDKTNPRRALFMFKDDGNISQLEANCWNGSLTVPAQGYFDTIRRLKTRLYS